MFASTLASLTVVPLMAAWSAERAPWRSWDLSRRLEAALLTLVLAGLAYGVLEPSALPQVPPALLYLPFPLLLWSAMRLGPAPTTAFLAFVSLLAVWGAAHGLRPFGAGIASDSPLTLHLFLACTALSVLILGAVFAERQEAMLDLGRSQRRFARAFHANPSAVSMIASDGRVIDVNERWCRLFGHPPERAVGATVEALGLDVDPADPASIRSRLAGTAVEEHREMRVRDAGGRIRDVVMAMTPTRLDGELCSIVSFVDIGDRIEAEKALRASDQRFRFVLEATRDVVYDRDLATGSTWVSRNGLAQFGYAPGVSDGVDLRPLVHPDDWARVTTRFTAAVRAGSVTCETDYRLRRADGSYAHVHEQAFVVSDGDGRARRVIGVVTDITEQHQREELARRLSQASRLTAMGELAASIAHEINQPVSAILSNVDAAEMLLQESSPPPRRAARCPGRHPQRRPARDRHHPPRPRARDEACHALRGLRRQHADRLGAAPDDAGRAAAGRPRRHRALDAAAGARRSHPHPAGRPQPPSQWPRRARRGARGRAAVAHRDRSRRPRSGRDRRRRFRTRRRRVAPRDDLRVVPHDQEGGHGPRPVDCTLGRRAARRQHPRRGQRRRRRAFPRDATPEPDES